MPSSADNVRVKLDLRFELVALSVVCLERLSKQFSVANILEVLECGHQMKHQELIGVDDGGCRSLMLPGGYSIILKLRDHLSYYISAVTVLKLRKVNYNVLIVS